MPDAGFHGKIESEQETLFSNAERADGTYTQEFTMDGHEVLYVSHVQDWIDTNTSIQGTPTITNAANAIDGYLNISTDEMVVQSGDTTKELIIDFGSAAARDITFMTHMDGNHPTTTSSGRWEYQTSNDDITYSSSTTLDTGTNLNSNDNQELTTELSIASFRYLKLILVWTAGTAFIGFLYEVYETSERNASSAVQFELYDDERSAWIETKPVATTNAIVKPDRDDTQTETLTKVTIPNMPSTKLRCKLTISDGAKSRDSVTVWKDGAVK